MIILPFEKSHLSLIQVQKKQEGYACYFGEAEMAYMESEHAYSAIDDGKVIMCAGVIKLWQGRGHAWALISDSLGIKFARLHKAVMNGITLAGYQRLEMDVDSTHEEAIRWARLLGFKNETPNGMINYSPDGRTFYKFVRIT